MEKKDRSRDLPDALLIFGIGIIWAALIYAVKSHSILDMMLCVGAFFGGIFMIVASKKIRLSMEQLEATKDAANRPQ